MDKITALCKRRGFIFPSSEIYGGLASTYDYGHYGVLLKGNVKNEWWRAMLRERDDVVALDAAILMAPKVWEASGHLESFTDPLVDCRHCEQRFRADHLRLREHPPEELSHYSSQTSDVEYLYPIGWSELEGIANRGDFDLVQHAKYSGKKLEYFDSATGERYVPEVVEPSAGADRAMLAFMIDSYDEEEVEGERR